LFRINRAVAWPTNGELDLRRLSSLDYFPFFSVEFYVAVVGDGPQGSKSCAMQYGQTEE